MNTILKQLQELADTDLYALSDAIATEMDRRDETIDEPGDSARRRAVDRQEGYRRRSGSGAPPVRIVGFGKPRRAPLDRVLRTCFKTRVGNRYSAMPRWF